MTTLGHNPLATDGFVSCFAKQAQEYRRVRPQMITDRLVFFLHSVGWSRVLVLAVLSTESVLYRL